MYKILEEVSISITSDHLPVTFIDFVIQRHNLVISQPKLPAWHKGTSDSIEAYKNLTERTISELLQTELKDRKSIDNFVPDLSEILLSFWTDSSVPFSSYNPTYALNGQKR